MSLRVIITMGAKPGRGGELLQLMEARGVGVRQEPGCEHFEVFQSGQDADRLCLLERWTDQAALDAHSARNETSGGDPAIADARAAGSVILEQYEFASTTTTPRPPRPKPQP